MPSAQCTCDGLRLARQLPHQPEEEDSVNPWLIYRNRTGRSRRAAVLLLIAGSLIGMALVSTGSAVASKGPLRPPGNVYTCPWIAEHPVEAAQARVSCDPGEFMKTGRPSLAQVFGSFSPLEDGSAWVPGPHDYEKIGQGVFSWTSYKYTNWWGWYGWGPQTMSFYYTWYVQKPGNITKVYGSINDWGGLNYTHDTGIITANNHRWGVQNHTSGARNWALSWHD